MTAPRPHSWHQKPDIANLSPDSYTAERLQHATPEHLHLTSRRFFIGPIPAGWLKTQRRDWYKHHLHINYSSRTATFGSDPQRARTRRLGGLDGPSASARFQHSFPQPEELSAEDGDRAAQTEQVGDDDAEFVYAPAEEGDDDAEFVDVSAEEGDVEDANFVDALSEPDEESPIDMARPKRTRTGQLSAKSFVTASSQPLNADKELTQEEPLQATSSQASSSQGPYGQKALGKRPVETADTAKAASVSSTTGAPSVDAASETHLLPDADVQKDQAHVDSQSSSKGVLAHVKRVSSAPMDAAGQTVQRTKSNLRNLVKFDIPEDSKRAELHLKAKAAQMTIQRASTKLRRKKLPNGIVLKMERMLVRVDQAGKDVPDDFDENGSQKVDSRVKDKWREYMVVCRRLDTDDAEYALQMYKTRVIPEIEQENANNRAAFVIPIGRKISKVNLYSSLDKSIVVWRPVSRGTEIFIMQARTASSAIEWYTFLRDVMGWRRATELQINIPDLSVSLHVADPFKSLEASQLEVSEAETADTEEAILRTMKEEQAVAQRLIKHCLDQLQESPEWSDVLESWIRDQRMGLAWKRYDRLEWIHGANERKMFGTIAMQKSHELELRPKSHYPTTAVTKKKHKTLTEPTPVEGFLIRLTSQRGRAMRLGLMYHKQLYFSTHDQFLVFSRPPRSTPPPAPRSSSALPGEAPQAPSIANRTPDTWTVDPYPLKDNHVEWLLAGHSGTPETRRVHDEDAYDESGRKWQNLLNCDGYINLADIKKVRKAKKGAVPADEEIESGSDVDFDQEVDDTTMDDGVTKDFDVDRTLELVMQNDLIIRLQAADKARRKDWIQHLRALARYWRHRTTADINIYKSTRSRNLSKLNIDEEGEAYIGQFARKWEVTQSFASPQLYNLCGIAGCRSIHMSGMLYRKPRIHAPFTRCSVILTAGTLIIFQDVLRSRTGKELAHIHHERMANLDLRDCYVYSGLVTESDLLYTNQTFDANKPGHHALPRIYLEDGWTSTDEDVMTTFVVWHGKSKSWFRAEEGSGGGEQEAKEGKRTRLKRVAKLGSKGRSVVFRARGRAERDHWVLAVQNEIERVQRGQGVGEDFRILESAK